MRKILAIILAFLLVFFFGCTKENTSKEEKEIIIALLDTGISTEAIKNENLRTGWNYVSGNDNTEDRINHGTAVASVILGCESANVAGKSPSSIIVPLVVTDKVDGEIKSITPEELATVIRESVDKFSASIINVSLGIKEDSTVLREAVEYVQNKGALVISAVGNEGESMDLYYPASYENVLAVGSHDKNMKISDFTQQNGTADLLAPGEDIWLASRNGKTYGAKGTSYASGYVSAAAWLIWSNDPKISAEDVSNQILNTATSFEGQLILNTSLFTSESEN